MSESENGQIGDFASLDLSRQARIGMPEVIYAPHKLPSEIREIAARMLEAGDGAVVATRCSTEVAQALSDDFGDRDGFEVVPELARSSPYRTVVLRAASKVGGLVAIVTAGTSDLRVAWECDAVLRSLGLETIILADVGVAGLGRTLNAVDRLSRLEVDVVVVVAGMEGALASVMGGLIAEPIIAVPTSTGYGSSFEGATALLAMTASCAQGVSVVGIDNGFGAACSAFRIISSISRTRQSSSQ